MTTTKERPRPPTVGAGQQDTLAAMQMLLAAGVPVLLWGDPGTGKTKTVEAYAHQMRWEVVSVIASIHDPTDFAGLPVRTDSGVVLRSPGVGAAWPDLHTLARLEHMLNADLWGPEHRRRGASSMSRRCPRCGEAAMCARD